MSDQMMSNLIANADEGECFGGLRQPEASRFQAIAFYSGRGVVISVDDASVRTYRATFAF